MPTINYQQSIHLIEDYLPDQHKPAFDKQKTPPIICATVLPDSSVLIDKEFELSDSWCIVQDDIQKVLKNAIAATAQANANPTIDAKKNAEQDVSLADDISFVKSSTPSSRSDGINPSTPRPTPLPETGLLSYISALKNLCEQTKNIAITAANTGINYAQHFVSQADTFLHAPKVQLLDAAIEKGMVIEDLLQQMDADVRRATSMSLVPINTERTDSPRFSITHELSYYCTSVKAHLGSIASGTVQVLVTATACTAGVALGVGGIITGASTATIIGGGLLTGVCILRNLPDTISKSQILEITKKYLPEIDKENKILEDIVAKLRITKTRSVLLAAEIATHTNNLEKTGWAITSAQAELHYRNATDRTQRQQSVPGSFNIISTIEKYTAYQASQLITMLQKKAQNIANNFFDVHKADRQAEARFKKENKNLLYALAMTDGRSEMLNAEDKAFKAITTSRSTAETLTLNELRQNITVGYALVNDIMASEVNFGIAEHKLTTATQTHSYLTHSNLTTVRCIAQYIDVLSHSDKQAENLNIQQMPDGSYVVADPERKLYNFMSGNSNAYVKFIEQEHQKNRMVMVMDDYRSHFPGGTNQMEFETQLDTKGNWNLTLRFSKNDLSENTEKHPLNNTATRKDALHNMGLDTPAIAFDFSTMNTADLQAHIESLYIISAHELALARKTHEQNKVFEIWAKT